MAVSKITSPITPLEEISKINEIIDNYGTVKTVNNTSPDSNGNVTIQTGGTVDQTYSASSANAQSGVAINGAKFIQNTATGTNSLTINGTASSATSALNIGATSTAGGGYSVAVGYYAASNGARTTSIGYGARIGGSTADAIQIGNGTNSTAKTLSVGFYNTGNYPLLDGATGLIPLDRISVMGGAGSSAAGTKGLVPAPASGDNTKFLRGDGTWQTVSSGSTYSAGTGLALSGTTFNHSNSVTAGTAGTSSATSGSTLAVPYVTYDAQGHITATGTHTHTVTGFVPTSRTVNGKALSSNITLTASDVGALSASYNSSTQTLTIG